MNNYNSLPEGFKEIPVREWQHGFFMYCLGQSESRCPMTSECYDLRMFEVAKADNSLCKCQYPLGYAIVRKFINHEPVISFGIYGLDEDWKMYNFKFAAQFAGDNS